MNGKRGLVPSNFVEKVPGKSQINCHFVPFACILFYWRFYTHIFIILEAELQDFYQAVSLHQAGGSAGDMTSLSGGSQTSHDLDLTSSDDVMEKYTQQEMKGKVHVYFCKDKTLGFAFYF